MSSQWSFPASAIFNIPPPQHPAAIPPSVAALFGGTQPKTSAAPGNNPLPASPVLIPNRSTTPKSSRTNNHFPCVASMPLLGEDRPLVPFYATPPRIGQQFLLRRQHSSTAAVCTTSGLKGRGAGYLAGAVGKNGRYTTPPPMRYGCGSGLVVHKGSDHEEKVHATLHFAASKFSDSPSAKSLPPPPSQWMEEIESRLAEKKALADEKDGSSATAKSKRKVGMDGIEEEETTSDDTGVVFDLEDVSPTASFDNIESNAAMGSAPSSASTGVRVDPMKLIAAASVL